jgi:hypothetical protein
LAPEIPQSAAAGRIVRFLEQIQIVCWQTSRTI